MIWHAQYVGGCAFLNSLLFRGFLSVSSVLGTLDSWVIAVKGAYSDAFRVISLIKCLNLMEEAYSPKRRLNVENTVSAIQRCP